ncbi:MAG: hypothetical protein ACFFD4_32435, partial [Candidatus Odinarchaeota archaeon]
MKIKKKEKLLRKSSYKETLKKMEEISRKFDRMEKDIEKYLKPKSIENRLRNYSLLFSIFTLLTFFLYEIIVSTSYGDQVIIRLLALAWKVFFSLTAFLLL